jgi:hypothetical protein
MPTWIRGYGWMSNKEVKKIEILELLLRTSSTQGEKERTQTQSTGAK